MAGVDVTQLPLTRLPFGVKEGGKFRVIHNLIEMVVQPSADLQWRIADGGQRSQQRLQVGHQDRCRDALSTDVRNGNYQAAVGELQNVVVIPGNPTSRNADGRKIQAAMRWKLAWEEGLLDPE